MAYPGQLPSAQPTGGGARRHVGGASARFRQDINMQIDAYESWERPLYVAKFLDMDRILPYLWIRIFISVKIRKTYLKIRLWISWFGRSKRVLPAFT